MRADPITGDDAMRVTELRKRYGGVEALSSITLGFARHQITAIVGDNGAGKSTLLKIMSGERP